MRSPNEVLWGVHHAAEASKLQNISICTPESCMAYMAVVREPCFIGDGFAYYKKSLARHILLRASIEKDSSP